MNSLALLLVVVLAVLFAALFASMVLRAVARRQHEGGEWPFQVQKPLSRIEQILYYRMVQTLTDQVVLAQVPLSRILRVRKGQTWNEWHGRISQKSIDFVVCERDFTIVAAIELDHGSHDSARRSRGDATKARALTAAAVPLVRWRTTALPTVETIRAVIDEIREDRRDERRDNDAAVPTPPSAPALLASRIDASNDPTMFNEETRP